uniref:Uncharacterized protein n=1 Tax=Rhizophora mucronata TaxID=61149 RepID=A0A2P2Q5K0_RHIMU
MHPQDLDGVQINMEMNFLAWLVMIDDQTVWRSYLTLCYSLIFSSLFKVFIGHLETNMNLLFALSSFWIEFPHVQVYFVSDFMQML